MDTQHRIARNGDPRIARKVDTDPGPDFESRLAAAEATIELLTSDEPLGLPAVENPDPIDSPDPTLEREHERRRFLRRMEAMAEEAAASGWATKHEREAWRRTARHCRVRAGGPLLRAAGAAQGAA